MRKLLLVVISVCFVFSLAYAGDFTFTYVGYAKCMMCHKGEKKGSVFEKWEKGPHAKALETLKKDGSDKKAECLECHVTAFNKSGYKIGDANAAKFGGVQCEECHGPGSVYKKMSIMKDKKKSIESGLLVPTEETCKRCHNKKSPKFKGFDYKEYLKKIDHTYTQK